MKRYPDFPSIEDWIGGVLLVAIATLILVAF